MDLHHIKYFLAVCDTMNFTKAAEQCAVTQPALSRAIQQLEDEVGGLLFRRERSLTHLTDLGQLMRPRFQSIAASLLGVQRELKRIEAVKTNRLMVGVLRSIGPRRLAGFLAEFHEHHPATRLEIVECMPGEIEAQLENGELDAAIAAKPGQFDARFAVQHLFRERFLIAFGPGHRFAAMSEVPFVELDGEAYLRRLTCEFRGFIADELKERHCHLNVCFQSNREDWILNMVAGGLGICFIPEFSAVTPGISVRPIVDPPLWRDVLLVSRSGGEEESAMSDFKKAIGRYPWTPSAFAEANSALSLAATS